MRGWLGRREWELPAADFPRTDWSQLRDRLDAREPFERFRFARLDPERRLVHLELTGRALFDKDGRFAGYRGVGRDVTHERQQQVLLQVESDLAEIMRAHRDTHEVVTTLIVKLCSTMASLCPRRPRITCTCGHPCQTFSLGSPRASGLGSGFPGATTPCGLIKPK